MTMSKTAPGLADQIEESVPAFMAGLQKEDAQKVINSTDRIVKAAHVDRDYTKRLEPEHILAALRSLNA